MTIGHIIETSHNCNTFRMIPYAPYLLRSPSCQTGFTRVANKWYVTLASPMLVKQLL